MSFRSLYFSTASNNIKHKHLKNEEIASLDENPQRPQLSIILIPIHDPPINPILAPARARDSPRELKLGPTAQLVHQPHKRPPSLLLLLPIVKRVDQVLQLGAPELTRAYAEDEADGVHEVGFSGPVRADNGGEVEEWADCLKSFV